MSDDTKQERGRKIADSLIRAIIGATREKQRNNFYDFSQAPTTTFAQVASA